MKTPDELELFIVELYQNGKSAVEIERVTGVNNSTVGKILRRRAIPIRCPRSRKLSVEQRFNKFVVPSQCDQDCWRWKGTKYGMGYGQLSAVINGRKTAISAHRLSYTLYVGTIPTGLCVLHKCDNPECTNPKHLFLGTPGDNVRDKHSKGRNTDINGEKNAMAKLTEADIPVIIRLAKSGLSEKKIAEHVGVTHSTIGRVIRGQSWKHIQR